MSALKTEVNKLDIDKLVLVPGDLSKLSKEVQEDFIKKKTDFDNLKTNVDDIYLIQYVLKSKYDSEIGNLKLKIPDISGLATKVEINTVENKIPSIRNLVRIKKCRR